MDAGYVLGHDRVRMEDSVSSGSKKIVSIELGEKLQGIYCLDSAFLYAGQGSSLRIKQETHSELFCTKCTPFILQQITGRGHVYLSSPVAVIQKELASDEILRVEMGSLVAMSAGVAFDYQVIGSSYEKVCRCVATLVGPGRLWLQHHWEAM